MSTVTNNCPSTPLLVSNYMTILCCTSQKKFGLSLQPWHQNLSSEIKFVLFKKNGFQLFLLKWQIMIEYKKCRKKKIKNTVYTHFWAVFVKKSVVETDELIELCSSCPVCPLGTLRGYAVERSHPDIPVSSGLLHTGTSSSKPPLAQRSIAPLG